MPVHLPDDFKYVNPSLQWLWGLWAKVGPSPSLLTEGTTFEEFKDSFLDSPFVVEGHSTVLRVDHIRAGHLGIAHGLFFSPRVFALTSKIHQVCLVAMEQYDLVRLECMIPEDARALNKLVQMIGFELEGVLHKRWKNGLMYGNMNMYAIVRR
jgi:hypothetical protein